MIWEFRMRERLVQGTSTKCKSTASKIVYQFLNNVAVLP